MASKSTRTGHRTLDFPELHTHRYHSPDVLPIVLLFKSTTAQREEILAIFKPVDSENEHSSPIEIVSWLRSFTPTQSDIPLMAAPQCIFVDKDLLGLGLCIICHGLNPSSSPQDNPIFEFATVEISEAYKIVTDAKWKVSWFPETLPESKRLELQSNSAFAPRSSHSPAILSNMPSRAGEIIVLVTVNITEEQKEQIRSILLSPAEDEVFFLHIPNTSDEVDDMDHIMELFLEHAWFPGDFAVVDAQTLAELSAINNKDDQAAEYPSLVLATSLQIWNKGKDHQAVSLDEVGYAIARRVMEDEEEYGHWCGNVFRGMGLRSYIGWEEAASFEGDLYYWGCWLNDKGRVDGEVRGEIDVRY